MSNVYIGTDIVEVDRIRSSIQKTGERFLNRIFTQKEQAYCKSKASPEIHYAGRFAAKEAIMKALKSGGYANPIPFNAIDVQSKESGEPIVVLKFENMGVCRVSISHTSTYAIASAIYSIE